MYVGVPSLSLALPLCALLLCLELGLYLIPAAALVITKCLSHNRW